MAKKPKTKTIKAIIKALSPPKTAKDWRRWLKQGEKSKLSPLERAINTWR